jgi:DNA-binding beta-propeller fold protein YncE
MKTLCTRLCGAALIVAGPLAQSLDRPVRGPADPGIVTTRQAITPAGVQTVFEGRVYGLTFGASAAELWVLTSDRVYLLDWKANRVLEQMPLARKPGLQAIQYDPVAKRAVVAAQVAGPPTVRVGSSVTPRGPDVAQLLSVDAEGLRVLADNLGRHLSGALAVAARADSNGRRIAAVPLVADNQLAVVNLDDGGPPVRVSTGIAPFGVALNDDGTVAFVSNWGGRRPTPSEPSAPTGGSPTADKVLVDARGIAASGTVVRLDLASQTTTDEIPVGLHPTALAWDRARNLLFVANTNDDTVSIIDTIRNRVVGTIRIQPFQQRAPGVAPTALAVSPDGTRLFVACGGINAIAVVNVAARRVAGLIPTAWYPDSLSISADGRTLGVATLLGAGSGWRRPAGTAGYFLQPEYPAKRHALAFRGSVSVIDVPDDAQLASFTSAVAENNHLTSAAAPVPPVPARASATIASAVPRRSGDPSLIEHVVYIIKENRTYDQVLGDMSKGNGDPSLVLFGEEVTPNHHRLADQFVLIDNFYAAGGNSGDGHQWATQANETAYCLWPGYTGRSYPFDGADPLAYVRGGFIWDQAVALKRSVRVFGEFMPMSGTRPTRDDRAPLLAEWRKGADFRGRWTSSPLQGLKPLADPDFPAFNMWIPDVIRAQLFLGTLDAWNRDGKMPSLTIVQLPGDHTVGVLPGYSTPKAMMADNDLALGQIVEGLTRSRFWPRMAIFVVEDDAQDGVDHVDGHRTVAMAISPYTKRGHVDSTFYSHPGMLKTIELILGLPSLSLFDLIANDMGASFTSVADTAPYSAVTPGQSLDERSPSLQTLRGAAREAALASMRMRFDEPDQAPSATLDRILWHSVRGWSARYPAARRATFAPLAVDLDDDDRRDHHP